MQLRSTATLTLWLLLAAAGSAHASDLTVLRAAPPAKVSRPLRAAAPQTRALTPSQAQHLEDLGRRWRSIPDQLSRGRVNWSRHASRRANWRRPSPERVMKDGVELLALPADTLRVAFIRVDFLTDRGGVGSTGDGKFDLSGPDTLALPIDPPPHNRTFFARHLEAHGSLPHDSVLSAHHRDRRRVAARRERRVSLHRHGGSRAVEVQPGHLSGGGPHVPANS